MQNGPPFPLYETVELDVVGGGGICRFSFVTKNLTRVERLYFDERYQECRVRWQLALKNGEPEFSGWVPASYFSAIGTDGKLGQPIHTKTLESGQTYFLEFTNYGVTYKHVLGVLSGLWAPGSLR